MSVCTSAVSLSRSVSVSLFPPFIPGYLAVFSCLVPAGVSFGRKNPNYNWVFGCFHRTVCALEDFTNIMFNWFAIKKARFIFSVQTQPSFYEGYPVTIFSLRIQYRCFIFGYEPLPMMMNV